MTLVKNKLAVAVAIALSTSFGLVGCGDDKSVSTAVGVPNPNTLVPVGTVQGVLRDTVTNEPIVGAIVDIGIAQAVTSETGQFIIKDVPATGSIGAAAAGENQPYQVTIDLRNVKQAAGAAKYPSFSFAKAAVTYSSLNDGSNDAGTSSSNHDTPVTGLVAPLQLTVGKLAAGIKGTVVKETDLKAVGAGYTVKLVSVASVGFVGSAGSAGGVFTTGNSTTGDAAVDGKFLNGNVVATTTTDASGAFVFSGIESLHEFRIEVVNADGTEYGVEQVRSPADGQVKTLLAQRAPDKDIQDLRTVFVKTTDTLAPKLVKTTPETGTERAPGANVTVTFSFSEPIVSNGLTNSLTAPTPAKEGLYDLVSVNFTGIKDIAMKASNIPYSLAWDATRTQLTVIIPKVKASANYEVSIAGAAGLKGILKDNNLEPLNLADGEGVVKFSTSAEGAAKPEAVSTLAITNSADLDQTNNAVIDWLPVAGAKGYHVYRAKFVNDVMDSEGYKPLTRTATDAVADTAQRDAAKAIADAAKIAAGIAAQVSVQAGQNVDIADVKANTAIKAAAPTTGAVADATAASAALTAPAATDARAAGKADVLSTSAVNAVASVPKLDLAIATPSNQATADAANKKVVEFNNAVAAAKTQANKLLNPPAPAPAITFAAAAENAVRTVNTKAMVAAKVAATVNAVADVAAAISAVSAADSSVAKAKLDAAQAAVDADPSNEAKKNVRDVAQTAFNNANKAAVDKAKEAKVAADVAKKALDDAKTAANTAKDAADTAKTDADKAKTAADTAKTTADTAKDYADAKATASTNAQKALTDAQKAFTDAQKAFTEANTAAEKEDAAVDLAKALQAVETAKSAAKAATDAAVLADQRADEAAAAAVAATAASTASTAAAKAATDAATAATAAVAAITTAVNAADAAADNVDLATASSAAKDATYEVLNNNANIVDGWRAYTAATVAKAMAAAKVMVVTDTESTAAKTAVADAAKQAADVVKAAQDIVAKATIAKTAVAATQTAAAAAATKAATNDTAAKGAVTTATTAVTTAATALTTAANATTTTAAVKTAVADAVAAIGTPDATAKTAFAKAAADKAKTDADTAKTNADTAKTNADADKVIADKAKTDADAAKAAADAAKAAADAAKVAADAAAAAAVPGTPDAAAKTAAAAAATAAAATAATNATNAATAATNAATAATNAATAATNAATAATNAATAATNAANVVGKVNNLIKAQLVQTNATAAATAAATALTKANDAKKAADTALTDVTAAETAAKTALTNATTAKTAADKLVVSMNAAQTSLKTTVVANDAAVKATADALTASTAAVDAAKTAATAAMTKQQADKTLATKVKEQAAADKALADAQGVVDSKGGYVDNSNNDSYLTQNTSFVESGKAFVDGIRKVTYKYKVRAVSEDNVESVDSNEVEAKDNTAPKVSSFTMNTASNVITVVFTEPMNELDFRNQANYVLSAPTGVTVPELSSKMFKIDNKTVVLTYAANIPAGSTVTVKGVKDLAGNTMSEVGNSATVDKVSSSIAGFVGSTQVTVFFSANMDKVSAETAANYVLSSGPALLAENGVVYDAANNSVTLTYVSAIPAGVTLTVSGVKDANGTVVDSNTKTFN